MANSYLVELDIEYKGVDHSEFLKIWLKDVNYYLEKQCEGKVKQLWKVSGERKVFIVIEQSSDDMDKMMFDTPLMKTMGDQVKVTVSEMIRYESFANNVNEMIACDTKYEYKEPVKKDIGCFYWAVFNVGYSGKTLDELLRLWSKEAAAALGAKSQGAVVDLWKCTGMRRVHCLLRFDTPNCFDVVTFKLPIMQGNGSNVDLKTKAVISFETFAETLKQFSS